MLESKKEIAREILELKKLPQTLEVKVKIQKLQQQLED